jgi:hypothetical protein
MNAKKQSLLKQLTLVLMLIIFACQLFSITNKSAIQYPSGEHPMGIEVSHHHSDDHFEEHPNDIAKQYDTHFGHHEHAKHSHTVYFPPSNLALASAYYQSLSVIGFSKDYKNLTYAPPIPPPTV